MLQTYNHNCNTSPLCSDEYLVNTMRDRMGFAEEVALVVVAGGGGGLVCHGLEAEQTLQHMLWRHIIEVFAAWHVSSA